MAQPYESEATRLRQQGNEHYIQGDLSSAVAYYCEAIDKADIDDPLPQSNLSAALFEKGDYSECIDTDRSALENGNGKDDQWKHRLTQELTMPPYIFKLNLEL